MGCHFSQSIGKSTLASDEVWTSCRISARRIPQAFYHEFREISIINQCYLTAYERRNNADLCCLLQAQKQHQTRLISYRKGGKNATFDRWINLIFPNEISEKNNGRLSNFPAKIPASDRKDYGGV